MFFFCFFKSICFWTEFSCPPYFRIQGEYCECDIHRIDEEQENTSPFLSWIRNGDFWCDDYSDCRGWYGQNMMVTMTIVSAPMVKITMKKTTTKTTTTRTTTTKMTMTKTKTTTKWPQQRHKNKDNYNTDTNNKDDQNKYTILFYMF